MVGGTSGESEERIRQIFEDAAEAAPSVLFIDAIDVIAGKKDVGDVTIGLFIILTCIFVVITKRNGSQNSCSIF